MDMIEHRVRERAYYIWEGEGRVIGRADAHWHQAETELAVLSVETAPVAEASVAKAAAKAPAARAKAPAKAAAPKASKPAAAKATATAKPKKAPRARAEVGIAFH